MKKLLLFLLITIPVLTFAQSPVVISQPYLFQKYITTVDSILKVNNLQDTLASRRYARNYVKWYLTGHGPDLSGYIRWIDTLGSGKIATKYYVEHANHTWYGNQTMLNDLTVGGNTSFNTFGVTGNGTFTSGIYQLQLSGFGAAAVNNSTGSYILLNSINGGLKYATIHAQNNLLWSNSTTSGDLYLPNKVNDTLATKGMLSSAISGVVNNAIKNQSNDSQDSTQSAGYNINGDAVFYKGIKKGIYNGNGAYLFSPVDSITYSQGNRGEAYYDPTGLVYQKTISARDTTRIIGNEPVQYEQELLSKTTPVNYFDVINKGYADSHYSSASVRDSALNINKNLYDLSSKSTSRANLFVYSKTEVDGLINKDIVYLQDSTAFASYAGVARVVTLRDSLIGDGCLFVKIPKGNYIKNGGTLFASNSIDSLWKRQFSGPFKCTWWGIKADYNPKTDTWITDNGPAIERMLYSQPMRSGNFYFPSNGGYLYYSGQNLIMGQATYISGNAGSFATQYNRPPIPVDTLHYKPLSGIKFGHNVQGVVGNSTDAYRSQSNIVEKILVVGSGRTELTTGIKFNSNPNYPTSPDAGLVKLTDVFVDNFGVGVDFGNSDTYWATRLHVSNCRVGVIGGKQQGRIEFPDLYDLDTAYIDKGLNNIIIGGEIEPGIGSVGIYSTAVQSTYTGGMRFTPIKNAIILKNGASGIDINNIWVSQSAGDAIKVDSVTSRISIHHNHFVSSVGRAIWVRKSSSTVIENNDLGSPGGTAPAVQIDSSTNVIYRGNIDNTYSTFKRFLATNTTFLQPLEYSFPQYTSAQGSSTPMFSALSFGGTFTNPAAVTAGQKGIGFEIKGATGATTTSGARGSFYLGYNEAWTSSANGTKFVVWVLPNGAVSGGTGLNVRGKGMYVGDTVTIATAWIDASGSTAQAPYRMRSQSSAPTTPNSGDLWNLSGVPQFYNGTVTNSLAFLASPTFTGTVSMPHLKGSSSAPTIAAGAGAGTSPTVSIAGTDLSGTITVTTGTSPTANTAIATVTFNSAYATAPRVAGNPAAKNTTTASLSASSPPFYTTTTTTLVIMGNSVALAPSTTYVWDYTLTQ